VTDWPGRSAIAAHPNLRGCITAELAGRDELRPRNHRIPATGVLLVPVVLMLTPAEAPRRAIEDGQPIARHQRGRGFLVAGGMLGIGLITPILLSTDSRIISL